MLLQLRRRVGLVPLVDQHELVHALDGLVQLVGCEVVFFRYECLAKIFKGSNHSVPVKHTLIFIPSPVFKIGVLIQRNFRISFVVTLARWRRREPQTHEWLNFGGVSRTSTRIEHRVELKVHLSNNLFNFKFHCSRIVLSAHWRDANKGVCVVHGRCQTEKAAFWLILIQTFSECNSVT